MTNKPDWTNDNDTKEKKWEELKQLAQGKLGMKVTDSQGNVKEHQEYARIKGEGSVAAIKKSAGKPDSVWNFKRRDKIPGLSKSEDKNNK